MSAEITFPPVEQTDHFRTVEDEWRARINSEDVCLSDLIDVLLQAREAGMPSDAQVSIRPGDCVVNVHVKSQSLVSLRRDGA